MKISYKRAFLPAALVVGAAVLTACAPAGGDYLETVALPPEPTAQNIPTSTRSCNANEMGWLIGQPETTLAAVSLAGPVEVINSGGSMPSGSNPQRLLVILDADGRISRLACG